MGAGDDDHEGVGLGRADLGDVDEELLAFETQPRVPERLDPRTGIGRGVEEPGTGIGVRAAQDSDHAIDATAPPGERQERVAAKIREVRVSINLRSIAICDPEKPAETELNTSPIKPPEP